MFVSISPETSPAPGRVRAHRRDRHQLLRRAGVEPLPRAAGRALASAAWRARRSSCRPTAASSRSTWRAARPLTTSAPAPPAGSPARRSSPPRTATTHVIATDMGGTSFEVGLVDRRRAAARRRGDPRPVHVPDAAPRPALDRLRRRLDRAGRRRTRAACASAPSRRAPTPGPACYGTAAPSRRSPTPTWCSGLIDPDAFLGGAHGARRGRRRARRRDGRRRARPAASRRRPPASSRSTQRGRHADPPAHDRAGPRPARLRPLRVRRRGPGARVRVRRGAGGAPRS